MKTIEINLYKFDELTQDVKQKVIDKFREIKYNDSYVSQWAVDDCYLFEPKHDELVQLFGEDYLKLKEPILGNSRKVYFDTDRCRHLDASQGIIVNNEQMFLKWLGIEYPLQENIYFNIKTNSRHSDTVIEFESISELAEHEIEILNSASEKFDNHMNWVLNKIDESIEFQYSDECIIDDIMINDYDFTEYGEQY